MFETKIMNKKEINSILNKKADCYTRNRITYQLFLNTKTFDKGGRQHEKEAF